MNKLSARLLAAAFAAALLLLPVSSASARGGFRGGGFRSAPSLRSFGGSRSLSGWGSATRPTLKASPFSGSRSILSSPSTPHLGGISGARSAISAQRGLFDSARRTGTLFASKAEASAAFRNSYSRDYSSVFSTEPVVRPSYIPGSALVGGQNVNIVYNSALGGYGYYHPSLGTWMLFDALANAAVLDQAMSNRGYYWGGAPVYVSHRPSFLGFAFGVLILFLVASLVIRALARRRGWRE
jgi:hypothetical protein